ncbi:unnamed protein product [Sphenostylis stenocarpa]|uniref:Uncharacterized protein n=1 Tax=Sphenostylis stenocarpa TaxID=92480 RepID=A0AA86SQ32_9FABA|nr:unnamed protein product [Sphenostylis stenocarpa]
MLVGAEERVSTYVHKKTVTLLGRRYENFPSYTSPNWPLCHFVSATPQHFKGHTSTRKHRHVSGKPSLNACEANALVVPETPRVRNCNKFTGSRRFPTEASYMAFQPLRGTSFSITNPNRNSEKIPQNCQQKRRKSKQF